MEVDLLHPPRLWSAPRPLRPYRPTTTMASDDLSTLEELEQMFDGEWTESAPLAGPPTQWSLRADLDRANLIVSIDFSPMNDRTSASFDVNASNFSFSGETKLEGFAPTEALRQLLDRFDAFCAAPLKERSDRS